MRTTLKRIDVGSAFRVGFVVYGLMWAIFGLLFVLLQSWLLNAFSRSISINGGSYGNNFNPALFMGTGLVSMLCFYGVGIIASAIGGGITFAVGAFVYNLSANWIGGIRIELDAVEMGGGALLDDIERDIRG
jgi:hypothetical protein